MRVVFWCRSDDIAEPTPGNECNECLATGQPRTFLWSPRTPQGVTELAPPPNAPDDRSNDFFCSGHTFDRDGGLIVVGGQDYKRKCQNTCNDPQDHASLDAVGHNKAYRLDTSVHPPVWQGSPWPAQISHERWYSSVISQPPGDFVIGGHSGAPSPACPLPCEPGPYPYLDPTTFAPVPVPEWRETLVLTGSPPVGTAGGGIVNRFWDMLAPSCADTAPRATLRDYPRLHLLSSRYVLHTNAHERTDPVSPPRTRFLGIDTAATAVCSGSNPFRWEDGDPPDRERRGGSSVHLIARGSSSAPYNFTEVVYVIGGLDDENSDPCQSGESTTKSIARLVGESPFGLQPTNAWDYDLPDMTFERANHNAVILLDGSILVVGGTSVALVSGDCGVDGTCVPVKRPELFRPEEIFGAPGTWELMACQDQMRQYHSVASLTRDGSVVSAGGTQPGHEASYHSVEIYHPWYWFSSTRPSITAWPDPVTVPLATRDDSSVLDSPDPDASKFTFQVDVPCFPIQRVALIAPSSATHAFDFNQRYVELFIDEKPESSPTGTVTVFKPEDNYVTPAGYYYLVVIDAQGVPSQGRWVRIGQSDAPY